MCGIFGMVGAGVRRSAVEAGIAALAHRGPDDEGVYLDPRLGVGLGHRRLAILDPGRGHQPMCDADGHLVLVCNGEIYPDPNMREDLARSGHVFRTHSDSELIIALYKRDGDRFVESLRGEFAFLLLDRSRKRLYACRDRFAIKPLMVCRTADGGWAFASEAKALFASGACQARLDWPGYQRDAYRTVFAGVYDLPAASLLIMNLESGEVSNRIYWKPAFPKLDERGHQPPPEEGWRRALDRTLTDAISVRLKADVPVGVYLSGGLDSAIVAAKVVQQTGRSLRAYTVSFPDAPPPYDEVKRARAVAEHLGLDHTVLAVTEQHLWAELERCLWHNEAPLPNLAPVAKMMLARRAKNDVTVVLTGEGADEVFLGYGDFRRMWRRIRRGGRAALWLMSLASRLVDIQRRLLAGFSLRNGFHSPDRESELSRLLATASVDMAQCEARDPVVVLQYRRLSAQLRRVILTAYSDRMEMSHGIEGRLPFLDHRLFDVAKHIPVDVLMGKGEGKAVLRELARTHIPDEVTHAPKWRFSFPEPGFGASNGTAAYDAIRRQYLHREAIRSAGLFRWNRIRFLLLLRRFRPLRHRIDRWLFTVCCLQILHRRFCSTHEPASPGCRP